MEIITTIPEKCKRCYSCVRNCPVKAVRIENGQAHILQSRCLNCGNCIKNCSQDAKKIYSGIENVKNMLANDFTIALLAPSYKLGFYPTHPNKLAAALRSIGFKKVWEASVGAELVVNETKKVLKKDSSHYISSACSAFVNLIEKHFPDLIKNLLPVVSPMIATGRLLHEIYGKNIKVVFIGPCIAKKGEIREPQFEGIISEALTFDEIGSLLNDLNIGSLSPVPIDSPSCKKGSSLPLSGNYSQNLKSESIVVDGNEDCMTLVNALENEHIDYKFIDVLFCKGCIDGPKIEKDLSPLYKKQLFKKLNKMPVDHSAINIEPYISKLDLSRYYINKQKILKTPTEDEIKEILRKINKFNKSDELNCGACGYNSCREKAVYVYNGIAEIEMCMPYLLSEKNLLLKKIYNELSNVNTLNRTLDQVIESSYDGLVINDTEGNVLKCNKAWKNLMLNDDDTKINHSPTNIVAIKEKRQISMLEEAKNGTNLLVTSTPILDEKGDILRIVSNLRDINELMRLKVKLERQKYFDSLNHYGRDELQDINIVANSDEFGKVLKLAQSIAKVDSTVLILGESGTGKEVVARYIHNISTRKSGPFVVVNCAAIPESLIESELFGYDSGAFTGAKKEGKMGLFELADKGTIFLDEIGELPLNMQAKILQVIQEKKIMRLGSTKSHEIDFRIIAATNRDLQAMVKSGDFRADLYYRINVIPIMIPPLRQRQDDILPLAYFFLDRFNKKYSLNRELDSSAKDIMLEYEWPGNVRELENLIERIVVTASSDIITPEDLPFNMNVKKAERTYTLKNTLERYEKSILADAYKKYKNTYKVARALGINQSTVVRKLKKYQIEDMISNA